jgi:hypothetical protein
MPLSELIQRPAPSLRGLATAWLGSRRALVVTGVVVVFGGLALGWKWLAAIGLAPAILSLAPCAAMCAIGACAMMKNGSSCPRAGSEESAALDSDRTSSAQAAEPADR